MRDFYGCYLLQSRKQGATGRTYIGCAPVSGPVSMVAATSLASEPCARAGSQSTRGGASGSTMARSRPALCAQSGEAARRAGKQCSASSALCKCALSSGSGIPAALHAEAAQLHPPLSARLLRAQVPPLGYGPRRVWLPDAGEAVCALRCLVLLRAPAVVCPLSPRAPPWRAGAGAAV